jgi:WD40 repeat protein
MTEDHWLATAAEFDSSVYMLNNSTQQFTLVQSFPQKKVHSVQISADHSYLVLGDNECYVYIYKLEDGKYEKQQEIETPPTTFCEVFSMSLTADGRELVVGRSGNFVNVYSNQGNNFTLTLTLQFQDFAFRRVKLTNDGKCLAIASTSFSQTNYSNLLVYKRPHSNF